MESGCLRDWLGFGMLLCDGKTELIAFQVDHDSVLQPLLPPAIAEQYGAVGVHKVPAMIKQPHSHTHTRAHTLAHTFKQLARSVLALK